MQQQATSYYLGAIPQSKLVLPYYSQRWETIYCNSIGVQESPNTHINTFTATQYTIHNILQYIANILGRICIFPARYYQVSASL
jgi:hypothetical protein